MKHVCRIAVVCWSLVAASTAVAQSAATGNPYARQVQQRIALLSAEAAQQRAGAAEALGFLRTCVAQDALIAALADESELVRREAALALGWCGDSQAIEPLLAALDDDDRVTRQSAHVALTNLTGQELPFDAAASVRDRLAQAGRWRRWWAGVDADRPPPEVLALLRDAPAAKPRYQVSVSSEYRGPATLLVDGQIGPAFWQTKNVPTPQSCTIDLGKVEPVHTVVVHQYGPEFVMTEYELSLSVDGETFEPVQREKGATPVELVVQLEPRPARFVRITSFGAKNPTYPTTFFEIEINRRTARRAPDAALTEKLWRWERGLRALGALRSPGNSRRICELLGPSPPAHEAYRPMVRAGIRSLGRLREPEGFDALVALLDNPMWARAAAEALGDFGDRRAVGPLIEAYARYAKRLNGADPADVPRDDKMSFPSEDRMLETPYCVAFALCRLPLDDSADRAGLRRIAPLLAANLPDDHDAMMLYQQEPGHLLTRHLLEHAGLRQEAVEQAMVQLGQPRRVDAPADNPTWSQFPAYRISSWLPAVCTDPADVPRLLALLEHPEGWVRLNAAKSLGWIGDRRAAGPIAALLAGAKAEAEFGFSGTFKDEEFNDPAPRWREGLIRALGLLGAHDQTPRLEHILNDPRSVLEVRRAAADALAELGNERAIAALAEAARDHSFLSVRNVARDALHVRSIQRGTAGPAGPAALSHRPAESAAQDEGVSHAAVGRFDALVFVRGDNNIPNTIGTVEQADRWRQTYVVTDSGPVYRPGRNLYVLRPPRPDGQVTPLTRFEDGYVGEPEVAYDGTHVLFVRRGQDDPWWHVWRVNVDGSGLTQLTRGPYHHVGPHYLPDGRIVLASTRLGIRDEYHGYPCTSLWVMQADGMGLHPIATNIGRDNEPSVLLDGRIVFSRLEVFYSRNKTELTLHAMHPDGTQDVVLYGPERRAYWRDLDHGPRTPADGQEAPLTHRVLRMTQPQPMPDGQHVIVATQGGLALVGPRRDTERIISPDNHQRAFTTPFPLADGRVLCASSLKTPDRAKVDVGLYLLDPETQELSLVFNDPATADFEPRPIIARRRPPQLVGHGDRRDYSSQLFCSSVFATQEAEVAQRGRLVRLIEGVPVVGRHSTQTNPWEVWKNHGGTLARVLGTTPVASDGSFLLEVPSDRLLHLQVLDSDRRVVGNQLTWMSARPGETKSCVGCHENPHTTTRAGLALATTAEPISMLPVGDEFNYRAKAWFKGHLPPDIERRTRTVRAVNLMGR